MGEKLDVGGQAIIEGVMMRGPNSMVIAVRRMDGEIVVKDSAWKPLTTRFKFLKWPLIRGATVMVEALVNGMQALSFSANVAIEDEEREEAMKRSMLLRVVVRVAIFLMPLAKCQYIRLKSLPRFVRSRARSLSPDARSLSRSLSE